MAGLCNCCRQVEGMRWREGGRETGSRREGRAEREICGDYSVSTRPEQREPRGQSPPPPSGPAKRAGTRRLVAVSATRNGAILDHEGVWVAGCERGWGGVVWWCRWQTSRQDGQDWQGNRRRCDRRSSRNKGRAENKWREDPGTSLAARHKRTQESTVRLLEPHPDAGSMRPQGGPESG